MAARTAFAENCQTRLVLEPWCFGRQAAWLVAPTVGSPPAFAARVAVSGGTAVCGSSTLGDGLCSGVGVGVARAEVRSGVSMMI